ncbi:MAG: hypothetical protein M3R55_12565, partial [Acidobacteriota bacterium]|nr:hypothetical protein [Acidobacteriota bacterium]
IGSIDAPALISLRLALFQLRHLSRTPAHAVLNDAVAITRRARATRAAGFVNGVLRGVLRNGVDAGLPPRPSGEDRGEWTAYLSTTMSHPRWLVERWIDRHGLEAADRWTAFNNQPAPMTLRVNTTRMTSDEARTRLAAEGIETVPGTHAPDSLIVTSGNPIGSVTHDAGLVALMDEASQLVGVLAGSVLGGRVLDACAAPGGKTLVLACEMPRDGLLIAADRRGRRVGLLRQSLERFGLGRVPAVQHDLGAGAPFTGLDGVLVDAPCSGLGTIRRDPDIRWRRAEADLALLADTQRALLAGAAGAVRPGGRVVYSTCSSEPEENEAVVDAFLADHSAFARVPASDRFTTLLDERDDLRTLPHRDALEAFYACVLERKR